LRIATRGSELARWQAERIGTMLARGSKVSPKKVDIEYVIVETTGDARPDADLHAIGGAGVFVKEVQQAVLDGRADVAVHSAKDLPASTPDGLVLAAVPERADPRDALVGASLDNIPTGGRVGTGSVRRRSQLANARNDLAFGPLRGNIATRLRKRGELGYDAVVVAVAALLRLGLDDEISEVLPPSVLLPQVAQGALAAECRVDDRATHDRLCAIDDAHAHRAVDTERAFLDALGGGCTLPCGALATLAADGSLTLDALLASLDGHVVLRTSVTGTDPATVGRSAARELVEGNGGVLLLEPAATPPDLGP
jgi:hydroxymethylbilane synthase